MSVLADERLQLALQLKEIEHRDENRKHLIRLCVMKALCLTQEATVPASSQDPVNFDALQKKVHAFELQVASLKMQLSTKEQAHAAKVDDLREEIARLKKNSDFCAGSNVARASTRASRGRVKLAAVGSPVSRLTISMSLFFAKSPFSDLKSGRGNSFSGDGIASVASQASFKLSRSGPKPIEEVFSPNNSSAESTPKKSKTNSDILQESSRIEPQGLSGIGTEKRASSETLTTSNTTVSDPEETFLSANMTFESEKEKKTKRKKIRLVSSEASKLILAQHDGGHDEEKDLNSLKYYQDENFESGSGSPARPQKRPAAAGPVTKKKHVFKIG
ncbi:hypothetical protein METBIDRAFT_45976 [Metschnikowia bicuspidata var. bicuspidata NRRL YB-4993]|uniref:Uncharacterized protein n=1 Tax=Metschnikowia bicuspidata var. bicuspidata NRRL YB-4993 TaxID=869754 RepID=A0A1A0H647_9ASCO|nr:hypothetical protein METBIDRAFT_45976 [Metschnikowia bicuspidata var. bicuspidata NRRL YB-4993]OBA19430.1 hypothetical protein METBIDRAFT_45976 [Metschnikowia bicuspidata var. bicuspidata NRRL YB-4993]